MTVKKSGDEIVETGTVIDTLAVNGPRQHLVRLPSGAHVAYMLKADEETVMPIDHALKFLCDKSFLVKDTSGKVIKAVKNQEAATHVDIPAGFVLAEYSELSREALVLRCKLLDGSEHIHPKKTPVLELIEFLKSKRPTETNKENYSKVSVAKSVVEVGDVFNASSLDALFDAEEDANK